MRESLSAHRKRSPADGVTEQHTASTVPGASTLLDANHPGEQPQETEPVQLPWERYGDAAEGIGKIAGLLGAVGAVCGVLVVNTHLAPYRTIGWGAPSQGRYLSAAVLFALLFALPFACFQLGLLVLRPAAAARAASPLVAEWLVRAWFVVVVCVVGWLTSAAVGVPAAAMVAHFLAIVLYAAGVRWLGKRHLKLESTADKRMMALLLFTTSAFFVRVLTGYFASAMYAHVPVGLGGGTGARVQVVLDDPIVARDAGLRLDGPLAVVDESSDNVTLLGCRIAPVGNSPRWASVTLHRDEVKATVRRLDEVRAGSNTFGPEVVLSAFRTALASHLCAIGTPQAPPRAETSTLETPVRLPPVRSSPPVSGVDAGKLR